MRGLRLEEVKSGYLSLGLQGRWIPQSSELTRYSRLISVFPRSLSPVPLGPDVFSESHLLLQDSESSVRWSC